MARYACGFVHGTLHRRALASGAGASAALCAARRHHGQTLTPILHIHWAKTDVQLLYLSCCTQSPLVCCAL